MTKSRNLLGVLAGQASLVAILAVLPQNLIVLVAGLALMAPLANALSIALGDERQRMAATTAFAVTASGLALFGIGAAFWGLVAGLAVLRGPGTGQRRRRRTHAGSRELDDLRRNRGRDHLLGFVPPPLTRSGAWPRLYTMKVLWNSMTVTPSWL